MEGMGRSVAGAGADASLKVLAGPGFGPWEGALWTSGRFYGSAGTGNGFTVPGYCWGKRCSQGSRDAPLSSRSSWYGLNDPSPGLHLLGETVSCGAGLPLFMARFGDPPGGRNQVLLAQTRSLWLALLGRAPWQLVGWLRAVATRFQDEIIFKTAVTCSFPCRSPSHLMLRYSLQPKTGFFPSRAKKKRACFRAGGHW